MRGVVCFIVVGFLLFNVFAGDCVDDICYWGKQEESIIDGESIRLTWIPVNSNFEIAATELTIAQFKACILDNGCSTQNIRIGDSCSYDVLPDSYPLTCVDWDGCQNACTWAGGRLCTDTEWSNACSCPDKLPYPYGKQYIENMCNLGLYQNRSQIAEPGTYRGCEGGIPGVYDMLGNVGEWIDAGQDDYRKFRVSSVAFNGPLDRTCSPRCAGNQRTLKTASLGCRCCRTI